MYLRIGIGSEDKPYHRFLWRRNIQDRSPDVYEFDCVVFGINSSPFLAQFVLQHHARKHQADYGRATETILKFTYTDDSMDSALDEKQVIGLYRQLSCLLNKAGLQAHKWLSNSPNMLSEVPIQDRKSDRI